MKIYMLTLGKDEWDLEPSGAFWSYDLNDKTKMDQLWEGVKKSHTLTMLWVYIMFDTETSEHEILDCRKGS